MRRVDHDDWRVTVTLRDADGAGGFRRALHEHRVEDEARERFGDRVAVGDGEEGEILLYAGTREAAAEAERVVRDLLQQHGMEAGVRVDRWHPVEERWEEEDVPLPSTDAELQAEHERLEQDEIAESEQLGAALWEVRIELASRHDADALEERLRAESDSILPGWTFSVVRRWRYLVIGADTEDQANEVARRLKGELPPGATIQVGPSDALAWRAMPSNPFAVFGGLGS
jgi:hypothetical protein